MWKLLRLADGPDGTLGYLESDVGAHWWVLEEEDQQNRTNVSRIPAGEYECRRDYFHAGGYETFEITGVPGRSRILFHIGNTEEDVSGCVAMGEGVGVLTVRDEDTGARRRKLAVTQSRNGFGRFMSVLRDVDAFTLRIVDPGDAA